MPPVSINAELPRWPTFVGANIIFLHLKIVKWVVQDHARPLEVAEPSPGDQFIGYSRHQDALRSSVDVERMRLTLARAGGCGRSSTINRKISWNTCRGMATSAIWKATQRPRLNTFAAILISFSFKFVSDR
jgi:hypothetical protein